MAKECRLEKDSVVLLEQLRTIDKRRLKEKITHLSDCLLYTSLVGTFLGWLILHEPLTIWFWIGSLFIFASVLLITLKRK